MRENASISDNFNAQKGAIYFYISRPLVQYCILHLLIRDQSFAFYTTLKLNIHTGIKFQFRCSNMMRHYLDKLAMNFYSCLNVQFRSRKRKKTGTIISD